MDVKYVFVSAYHTYPGMSQIFEEKMIENGKYYSSFEEASHGFKYLLVGEETGAVYAVTDDEITECNLSCIGPGNHEDYWFKCIGDLPEDMKNLTGTFEMTSGTYCTAGGGKLWQHMHGIFNPKKFTQGQWDRMKAYLEGDKTKYQIWKWFWYDEEHVCEPYNEKAE